MDQKLENRFWKIDCQAGELNEKNSMNHNKWNKLVKGIVQYPQSRTGIGQQV